MPNHDLESLIEGCMIFLAQPPVLSKKFLKVLGCGFDKGLAIKIKFDKKVIRMKVKSKFCPKWTDKAILRVVFWS